MSKTIRIASFNCENLFSRIRIFGASEAHANDLLAAVAKLEAELGRKVFDHGKIDVLKAELSGYATIQDVRGKHETAKGAADWLGWVELKRSRVDAPAIANTARVIADADADVVCLVEVEDRTLLQEFHDRILCKDYLTPRDCQPYEHVLLVDGNDDRGIDVAVLSRLPVLWMKSHVHELATYLGKSTTVFSRDCLEVEIEAKTSTRTNLRLFVNHFKSQGYNSPKDPTGAVRRKAQATRVAKLARALDLERQYAVIAGDLNCDSRASELKPLLADELLHNVNLGLPELERGTYGSTAKQQLDYLIVSRALRAKLTGVRIERRGVYSKHWPIYDTVTSASTAASDHAAVIATFRI